MNGQIPTTLDPSITQSMLMNSYSSANHDMHSIATRNGNYFWIFIQFPFFFWYNLTSWTFSIRTTTKVAYHEFRKEMKRRKEK